MKIDILGVQAFVAIADKGSFQNAADSLHVTQTAITQRLRKLEDFLGVMLVERTTRSIALSLIGRDFLPQARRLLEELGDALLEIRETGKAERGDVSIACVPTVGVQYLPRIMQEYSAMYPLPVCPRLAFSICRASCRNIRRGIRRTGSRFSITRRRLWPMRCCAAKQSLVSISRARIILNS